jgi:transcriptional regulator with XRE-family HTH domain
MTSEQDRDRVLSIIAERIEARRLELKESDEEWSQRAIAELAEVDLRQFNKIENADADLRITTLLQIAGGLGIDPAELIAGLRWVPGPNRGFGHIEYRDD